MYCTETKQAKISYSFGDGEQRLYLNRFCPFEVRVKDGLPSRFPDWNGRANVYTFFPNQYGVDPLLYVFRCAFWDLNVLNGQGIQHWYPVLSNSNNLVGFRRGDYNDLLPGAQLVLPVLVDSYPYTVSGSPIPATACLEIIHNGSVIYSDFGPAPCYYSVKCGNGCDEDRELTVTEVSNYPGTWCLTSNEIQKLEDVALIARRGEWQAQKDLEEFRREMNEIKKSLEG